MIKTLKFNTKDQNIWFFSDIHGAHEKDFIINPRGFKNAKEALETYINNWNSKVSNNDICFLLGDTIVGAGNNSEKEFSSLLHRLNYKELYIMPGNHFAGYKDLFYKNRDYGIDDFYRLSFRGKEHENILGGMVHFIPNYYEIYVNHQFIVLSHYPILSFNGQNKNSIHIFGHCHNNLIKSDLGKEYIKGRVLEVSPESIGNFPLSFSEVMSKIGNRVAIKTDHHDKNTN